MNTTLYAAQLIKKYNQEFNRLRRADYLMHNLRRDKSLQAEFEKYGLKLDHWAYGKTISKRTRDSFNNADGQPGDKYYVSTGIKKRALKLAQWEVDQIEKWLAKPPDKRQLDVNLYTPDFIKHRREQLQQIKETKVLYGLGRVWRRYVDAVLEHQEAYETRWQARCAIKAFNEQNLGITIKFGSNHNGCGGMNYIRHVIIDGDKIPYRKWLASAEFEGIVLAA